MSSNPISSNRLISSDHLRISFSDEESNRTAVSPLELALVLGAVIGGEGSMEGLAEGSFSFTSSDPTLTSSLSSSSLGRERCRTCVTETRRGGDRERESEREYVCAREKEKEKERETVCVFV